MKHSIKLILTIGTFLLSAIIGANAQETDRWQPLSTTNTCMARHEAAAAAINGKLYLLGGRGLKPVDVYDPETRKWEKKSPTPLELHHFQAIAYDGKIYVIGAFTGGFPHETPVPHIYSYDPASDSWTQGPEIPEDRRRGAAGAVVHNGKFYIAGGAKDGHWGDNSNYFDEYDPKTGEWRALADMPRVRDHFQAVVVDNKLYATAGRKSLVKENKAFELTYGEVDVYDFSNNTWKTLPKDFDLPTQRAGNATINYGRGFIVVGGESGQQVKAHDEVEYFDPEKGWRLLNRLTRGRHGTQIVQINNVYYIAAGCAHRGGSPELDDIEVLTIETK